MRAFAACLTVVLGFGAFSAVGCSSDATTGGTPGEAGEAGATTSPTPGGAGMSPGGGAAGEGGASGAGAEAGAPASTCSFDSDACRTCLGSKCMTQSATCINDDACGQALSTLDGCACDASKSFDDCATAFGQSGKTPAADLVTCYTDNCTADCQ